MTDGTHTWNSFLFYQFDEVGTYDHTPREGCSVFVWWWCVGAWQKRFVWLTSHLIKFIGYLYWVGNICCSFTLNFLLQQQNKSHPIQKKVQYPVQYAVWCLYFVSTSSSQHSYSWESSSKETEKINLRVHTLLDAMMPYSNLSTFWLLIFRLCNKPPLNFEGGQIWQTNIINTES